MYLLWSFLIVINIVAFIMMGIDKRRAKEGKYRIAERTLWLITVLGGALGGTMGMYYFRHKTKNPNFKFGFPLLVILQVWLLIKLQ